ncbi:hypothetical protein MCEMIE22_02581 [Mycobacteriaceae bacterium]
MVFGFERRPAVIVDVDDTLCDVSDIRHLYAEPDDFRSFTVASRHCPPRQEVLDWCHTHFHEGGYALLVVTGRSDEFRDITADWLDEHLEVPYTGLWMRPKGHYGSNGSVKREIHAELATSFDIRAAIDDDPLIVEMWTSIGIMSTLVPRF